MTLTLPLLTLLLAAPAAARADGEPASGVAAEAPTWTLSAGTGGGGFVEFVDAFAGSAPAGYDATRREDRLQLNLRADRALQPRLRAGLAYVFNRWTERYLRDGVEVGTIRNRVHTLLVDLTFTWLRTEHVELYGGVAAGAGRWEQDGSGIAAASGGTSSGFAFQLRYFGVTVGGERLRAFVDLGIGFEGLVVAGLQGRL